MKSAVPGKETDLQKPRAIAYTNKDMVGIEFV